MDPLTPLRHSLPSHLRQLRSPATSKCLVSRLLVQQRQSRALSTTVSRSNSQPQNDQNDQNAQNSQSGSTDKKKPMKLTPSQKSYLSSALRVNQAGELAATLIYAAQTPPILRSHPNLRPLMKHMYDQEAGHFDTFNNLLAKHQVRPTVMYPVWQAAATILGWGTGIMGREAAMACTEAVEKEIGTHYNEQVRELLEWFADVEERGEVVDSELKELVATLKRIRDEELEHLDHAVENDAKEARPYEPLVNVIRGGCRVAIQISQRI